MIEHVPFAHVACDRFTNYPYWISLCGLWFLGFGHERIVLQNKNLYLCSYCL